jgi:putative nucleotidyltransferase with HDIG domain
MSILNTHHIDEKILEQNNILYKNISTDLQLLFKETHSLENLAKVKRNVSLLVSTILENDFTLSSFLSILNATYYTHTHSLNVSVYAICLGKHLGHNQTLLEELGLAALLHDIGKSKISEAILYKSGKLTDQEFLEVSKHSQYGCDILRDLGVTNENVLRGVRNHHEKLDGTGYPDALIDNQIHLFAKIIGLCDVFDALSTQKKHKSSYSTFETLQLMKIEMKNHLDSTLINQFILLLKNESMKR